MSRAVSPNICYVCGHGPHSVSGRGLHFHTIPNKVSYSAVANNWLSFLHLLSISEWPNDDWKIITICSQHFEERHFYPRHQEQYRSRLVIGAAPTKNPASGPGVLGEIFSSDQLERFHSDDPVVEDAEIHTEMDTFEEESCGTNQSQVDSSLSTPDTPQRGALSIFKFDSCKYNLKRPMGYQKGQIISPRSYKKFQVAKYFKDKYLRQTRKRLDTSFLESQKVSREDSQVVDLAKEMFDCHFQNSTIPVNCRQCSDHVKALCLAFQRSSAKAYRLLRQVFTIPSSKTLTRIRQSIPLSEMLQERQIHNNYFQQVFVLLIKSIRCAIGSS